MQQGLPAPGALVAEKYVITRLLGRGGMGAVYVVEHRVTGKRLALKCLLPEHLEHPEFIGRFLREAQAAGRIQHRNVVDVFDVGQDGQLLYIVMELLDGKPLSELLNEGKLTLDETLQILLRAMEGVAAAHAVGIVHRDLKPDNIFVCVGQSGRLDDPRVLDFGISKLDDDLSQPLTKSGVMLGTPYYMAFEQINSQRDLDQRVDVYAMGVILYEAMAGQPPYVAESVGALAIRMMSAPPVPLSQHRPELPEGLAEVVMRSIARDREQRYPTVQALIEALRPYVLESPSLRIPKDQSSLLGVSLRNSHAVDATLPALRAVTPTKAVTPTPSSARLKLDVAEDHAGRTPSVASSSRSVLWVVGLALLVLILGGTGLVLALRGRDQTVSEPLAPEVAPATSPAAAAAKAAEAARAAEATPKAPPERATEKREPAERSPASAPAQKPVGAIEPEASAPSARDGHARRRSGPARRSGATFDGTERLIQGAEAFGEEPTKASETPPSPVLEPPPSLLEPTSEPKREPAQEPAPAKPPEGEAAAEPPAPPP